MKLRPDFIRFASGSVVLILPWVEGVACGDSEAGRNGARPSSPRGRGRPRSRGWPGTRSASPRPAADGRARAAPRVPSGPTPPFRLVLRQGASSPLAARPGGPHGGPGAGQLIAASLAGDLILGGIDAAGFLEDLDGDLLVGADGVVGRSSGELGPSRAITPTSTNPALAQRPRTWLKRSPRASWWRTRSGRPSRGRGPGPRNHPEGDVLAAAALDPS